MMLKDKIALITGGSRGIGAEIVKQFAKERATIVFTYSNSKDRANELINSLSGINKNITAVQADANFPETMKSLVDEVVGKYGRIDILVNNAGIVSTGIIGEIEIKDYEAIMNVNVHSVFTLTNAAVKHIPEGGRIINISSILGIRAIKQGSSIYNASKFAIQGFSRSWARDLASKGILVNTISPGSVNTEMNPDSPENPRAETIKSNNPLGRFIKANEVASATTFLASPSASGITGTDIIVDGGFNA